MPGYLNIETSGESASIAITDESGVIGYASNDRQQDHAAWLHAAVASLFEKHSLTLQQLDAVSVSIGPGSYTGLRIGLSAAKGFCFATGLPLITISTLELIAWSANKSDADLFCPLIDARRMEVFTAVYDRNLNERMQPIAMVLDQNSFDGILKDARVCFCGNGRHKLKEMMEHSNAMFDDSEATAANMAALTHRNFIGKRFSDLVYTEPQYVKEFYSRTASVIK